MIGPVILGVDDSSFSAAAIEVARDIAWRYGLPLVYAHVVDRADGGKRAEQVLHDAGVSEGAELAIEHGHPADRLVALSHELQASFLVVGNHGPRSSLLGSISADVSRRAPCPVIVVPPTVEGAGPIAGSKPSFEGGLVRFNLGNPVRSAA